jgi:endonuclease/exonuclease/phosphatase family metal-dependent hydrolase
MRTAARIVCVIALGFSLLACALHISNSGNATIPERMPGTIRIATYNVHYIRLRQQEGPWSVGDWERRRGPMDDAFKAIDADIFAFQEMESFAGGNDGSVNLARDFLLERNPAYSASAVGDWREFPSTQPILYRKDRLRVLDQGWFFFSDTPDVIYSRTFDGSYPAFASWVRFVPLDGGAAFYVFDVHFEYKSRSNRRLSAELVRDRIAPLAEEGAPVLVVGDINARAGSVAARLLEQAGISFVSIRGSTYHFNRGINLFGAIDHIAVTDDIRLVGSPVVLRQRFRGEWPSDHYPVFADFLLPD